MWETKRESYIKKYHPVIYEEISQTIGSSFLQKKYNYINNILVIPICECGNDTNFVNNKYNKFCSVKCSNNSDSKILSQKETYKITCIEKYGVSSVFEVPEIKEKISDVMMTKYGINHVSESEVFREKSIANMNKRDYVSAGKKRQITNIERYGVDNVAKLESSTIKSRSTSIEKYNFSHYSKTEEYKKRVRDTNINKYGVSHLSKDKHHSEMISIKRKDTMDNKWIDNIKELYNLNITSYDFSKRTITIKCDKCGDDFDITSYLLYQRNMNSIEICTICNDPLENRTSSIQKDISEFISKYYNIETNYIYGESKKEIDIYLPYLKIGFEVNGLYWHSDVYRDKEYHIRKTDDSRINGIKLIHIWEDDWYYNIDIIKSRILNILNKSVIRIYARKCEIREVSSNESKEFLTKNHLQKWCVSKIRIGLYYENELVSLMTLGKTRKNLSSSNDDNNFELLRFCNKLNHSVVGSASKLLKRFIDEYDFNELITYSNLDFGYTNFYEKLGFDYISTTKPGYSYIINGIRRNRYNYRKDELVSGGYNSEMTEREIMRERGHYRIYDCGNQKWKLKK